MWTQMYVTKCKNQSKLTFIPSGIKLDSDLWYFVDFRAKIFYIALDRIIHNFCVKMKLYAK
jgi:hypothetical protein